MRILEFQPGAYRNLPTGAITFTFDPNRPLVEGCSIRFLVGPNGVGKTNILRFLAGIFLALDEGFRRPHAQNPAYSVPFRLSYQLRQDTISVESQGHGRSGLRFTINDQAVDYFPSRDQILPKTLLVYTSGNDAEWRALFTSLQAELAGDEAELVLDQLRPEDEMPPYALRVMPESDAQAEQTDDKAPVTDPSEAETNLTSRIYLVEQSHLKLALLAALLDLQARQSQGQPVNQSFLTTLSAINVRLLSFAGLVNVEQLAEKSITAQQISFLSQLYDLATLPVQEWNNQRWIYDLSHLSASQGESTLMALHEALINDPFQFFQMLVGLSRANLLQKVDLIIRYTPSGAETAAARTLLSDGLSDGEFSFLARMALIYLLQEEECLFLLDEPEVHFNDEWKRNLVDSIEQALTNTHSEVILTSHASITLTDAFPDEVILLGLNGQRAVPLTLGAEPGEILRRLFNAERTVGRRAMKYIEDKIQNGTTEELTALLDEVGTGFYRFKIVEELQRRVSSP